MSESHTKPPLSEMDQWASFRPSFENWGFENPVWLGEQGEDPLHRQQNDVVDLEAA
jgi:hypothetical protein